MLKLQQRPQIKEINRTISVATNYTNAQIDDLFELGPLTPIILYKHKAKKLYDLGLSFENSKYLLHAKKFSVKEIVKCYEEIKIDIDVIRMLRCSKSTIFTDIPSIILKVGDKENLKDLLKYKLSIEEIKILFNRLSLTYKDAISLIGVGFKVSEIEIFEKENIPWSELASIAKIISATEVYTIFRDDAQNLKLILGVKKILGQNIIDLNSALNEHLTLYNCIPSKLCTSLKNCSLRLRTSLIGERNKLNNSNRGFEEIMMEYMDLAGGDIPIKAGISDIVIPKVFTVVEKIIKHFKPAFESFIEYIPVKPFILAAIWLALDEELEEHYLNTTENINSVTIAKSVLSFLLSSMCGITGYFHSGGVGLPFPNVTSYIKTLFNIQGTIKEYSPKIYNQVPEALKFNVNENFENLTKEKQISYAQGISMLYTYRVGNSFLCNILGKNIISIDTVKSIFKSLWPLPQQSESTRMYLLYSGIPLYTRLNLNDVFVNII